MLVTLAWSTGIHPIQITVKCVTTAQCTKRLQSKLNDNLEWARMKVKPSRGISVVKGKIVQQHVFHR